MAVFEFEVEPVDTSDDGWDAVGADVVEQVDGSYLFRGGDGEVVALFPINAVRSVVMVGS